MYLINTIIPIFFIFILLYKYDTYEIYLNANSNLITNYIYKISNYWSLIENNLFFLAVIFIIIIVNKNNNKININSYNLLILLLLLLFKFFNFYTNSNLFNSNNAIFNPLLTHFLVFIHPPIILILLLTLKNINFQYKKLKIFFYIYTFTLFLGSYWATSVFGWGGWWSWDPIENISLTYWFIFLLFIHRINKYSMSLYIYFFAIDFFLFFFLKFNNFQSVHIFKIIYINLQSYFIVMYFVFIFIFSYYVLKNKKSRSFTSIVLILNITGIVILFFFMIYIYIYISINQLFMYYILVYLSLFILFLLYYILNINNIYLYVYSMVIVFNAVFANYIFIYIFMYILIIYIYTIKKENKIYNSHILYIIIIYILFMLTNEIQEFSILLNNTYHNNIVLNKINEIDINVNYIEYYNKNNNLFISNYYNIYNIFEKIEFNIYNQIINNYYYNIKNNIIQIYKLKYIPLLFILIIHKIAKK
jgi:cytochrome c biogenesis factor